MVENLPEGILRELRRCREVLEQYKEIGAAGAFGAAVIQQKIEAAENAQASGDVLEMMRCYKALTEVE